jgi:YrbI family 3-deoxy-D-manno-octulosonate 8-phosphate phosphatase
MIKIFIMDVDGVLTDSGMYYSENGDELKRFSTYDGKAMEFLRNKGIKTAIITSENTQIVSRRSKKMGIDFLFQGVDDKLTVAKDLCSGEGILLESEASYVGDDVNDLELLELVNFKACPKNSVERVKSIKDILVLHTKGGDGAVREFVDFIISKGFCDDK